MIPVRAVGVAAISVVLLAACPDAAASAGTFGTQYSLITPPSSLQVGCQEPCKCAIWSRPTYGSFQLVPAGSDPLYAYYAVENYIASYNNGPGAVSITGSGLLKIGGEVALMQQLTLDLTIEGRPVEHFDSGLVPVRASFPQIDVSCAVHSFYCYDTVLVVDAKPVGTSNVPPPPAPRIGLQAVAPNPFTHAIGITFTIDRAQAVELWIVDLEGRRVRTLAVGSVAGPGAVAWDGLRDDGRGAPAGVYWVIMRWPGASDRRRIVKLD
jgi:hypothetical protein